MFEGLKITEKVGTMEKQTGYIARENLEAKLETVTSWDDARKIIVKNNKIRKNLPNSYAVDPRNDLPIIYVPARAKRPGHNGNGKNGQQAQGNGSCVICEGVDTMPVVRMRDLPDSKTDDGKQAVAFINLNLFPPLGPKEIYDIMDNSKDSLSGGLFLLWASNMHADIDNMSYNDNKACIDLMSEFEKTMLHSSGRGSFKQLQKGVDHYGHMQIIKNKGKSVGGSIEHGHYQMGYFPILPKRIIDDRKFADEKGKSFASYILEKNPDELEIKKYCGDVSLLVPCCAMKRPLDALIIPKDTSRNYLHDLKEDEKKGIAMALCDVTKALSDIMPGMGKEFAYNLEFHTSTGFYIEVLPFTQEDGGYERAGMFVCQSEPQAAAEIYNETFSKLKISK